MEYTALTALGHDNRGPVTLPLSYQQYETLVEAGAFVDQPGQIELIHGRLVQMNPQGPRHSAPIDWLTEWSIESARKAFTIRIEKPLAIVDQHSCPEPDVAWVTRRSYFDRHPVPAEVRLLIEISDTSATFDRTEKRDLYAAAKIPEYWLLDVSARQLLVFRQPRDGRYSTMLPCSEAETVSPLCCPTAKLRIADLLIQ